jgi:ribosomal protein S18 acetylase RimI-like enzyme
VTYRLDVTEIPSSEITIVRATGEHRATLEALVGRIEAEDHPEDPEAAARTPRGMAKSLSRYDALSSDSVWFLLAYSNDRAAGLAVLVRVSKLDGRVGFLYLDELHVLAEHRRRGIGTTLIRSAVDLARELGLAGIRLLTRPDNEAARALYESLGFHGTETLLYQIRVDQEDREF